MKLSKNHKGISVFYSYTWVDKKWRDQLATHLSQLKRDGFIEEWHDQQILAGTDRAQAIDQAIRSAHIVLLLISSDFLASDHHYTIEMQHALERHRRGDARVIPIILRPCDWQPTPLKDLQCLPYDGKPVTEWDNPDAAFLDITEGLRRVIEQQRDLARPPASLSQLDRQNRTRILKQVRKIWIDGVLTQSLHNAARIELHLQDRPDVLANPWRLQVQETNQAPKNLPEETTMVQVYDRTDDELLILGEPGAGKTTLLLELARTLIERAEKDERLPMPIVFHLSSWAEKRQLLRVWLVEELRTKYQIPLKIAQGWIDTDQILPLLDGLDEVAKDVRGVCVEQINRYYQDRPERGSNPIVVCCRSEEYASLSTRVMFQHAVSILPLTNSQINAYLEQAGEGVKALRQALNEDAELYSLAHQPLMLNIFTFAYQGATVAEISTGETRGEIQHAIFAKYVERMLKRREKLKRWKPEQVMRWLMFLAKQMQQHSQTIFSVENLQPTWLSKRWRILYQWCVGLFLGLLGGLVIGLVGGPFVGLIFGMCVGQIAGRGNQINPVEVLTWSWEEARLALVFVLVGGLVGGLVIGLVVGLLVSLVRGLLFGLVVALNVGLLAGLVGGLQGRQLPERLSLASNEGIWRSGKIGLIFGLVVGPIVGLVGALAGEMLFGLIFGLVVGSLIGLVFGLRAFVMHFILRFFLSWRGNLLWNLVVFLDETAERLLLRKVGGSYIFVHRQLLDYFAALDESMPPESMSSENMAEE